MIRRLLALFVLTLSVIYAQGGGIRVQSTDGTTLNVGDTANNAIRVNIVAGAAAGGTSSSYGAAFPASGTAAGFSDGTNMQGARVVDLDTGAGTVYGLIGNLVRRASGGPTEMIGQTTMALSLPVVLPSDQAAIPVTQSGTWTVQPGNTANTTPWLIKTVPMHGCTGNTIQDITQADVATGAGSDLTTADTCVFSIAIANVTTTAATVTLRDRQGTPIEYVEGTTVPGNSVMIFDFSGMKWVTGVKAIAGTASAINARLIGVQ
jgi:hypothetical protein